MRVLPQILPVDVVIAFVIGALFHAPRHRNDGSDAFSNGAAFDENIDVKRDKVFNRNAFDRECATVHLPHPQKISQAMTDVDR